MIVKLKKKCIHWKYKKTVTATDVVQQISLISVPKKNCSRG